MGWALSQAGGQEGLWGRWWEGWKESLEVSTVHLVRAAPRATHACSPGPWEPEAQPTWAGTLWNCPSRKSGPFWSLVSWISPLSRENMGMVCPPCPPPASQGGRRFLDPTPVQPGPWPQAVSASSWCQKETGSEVNRLRQQQKIKTCLFCLPQCARKLTFGELREGS